MHKKILTVLALVLVVAGASASLKYYHDAQRIKAEAQVLSDSVALFAKENAELKAMIAADEKPELAVAEKVAVAVEPVEDDPQILIHELEEKLRAKDEELAMLRANAAGIGLPDTIRAWMPEDRRDWLQNLQSDDPQRYQQIMERREQARQTARYELAKRAAHFLFRDDGEMTDQDSEHHQKMMNLLHESILLTESLTADMPNDQRREIGRELRRNMRELSPLLETERDRELYRIGKDLGYQDDEAAQFALYIRDVIDMTSVQSIFRNSMRAMGGGPWGNPGRPSEDR